MEFYRLETKQKEIVHRIVLEVAMSFGGRNSFLTIIEEMKREKTNPLLHQSSVFHHPKFKINWGKVIHKDSLTALFYAVKKEEIDGNVLQNLAPKDFKTTLNMVKALKNVEFVVTPKVDSIQSSTFPLFSDVNENDVKINIVFKSLFFYPLEYLKKALSYEIRELKEEE
ncbi:MAG: hypothetical protein L0Y61_01025 [Epsilonproteobacteria bacterium]|nr:hypothetical protein [Campylobacterota bacterium]